LGFILHDKDFRDQKKKKIKDKTLGNLEHSKNLFIMLKELTETMVKGKL
jgi:hypothetical protein